ncbi:MAG: YggS family pyridoxal phosphate-dependent enzyme [Chitinophagales bacterium]|nr:YggS family pyridoxal phosphate-dependent enzyme [Chitinophagales bacterium]MCO5249751.1 YggS family pyridoxal phosphate-dependent enzyme [Chitinophagales bacterium]
METILNNIQHIQTQINTTCDRLGRDRSEVKLLLATKTVTPERILIALKNGNTLIGENKIQELRDKFEALQEVSHQSHFIGHLQTNKIKDVIKYADCIESVDRLDLARKLQTRLEFEDKEMDVFLQVNTSYEESKFGVAPESALALAKEIASLDRLHLKGLMTIGLFSAETEKVRKCFKLLKKIQMDLSDIGIEAKELSMGMSHDFVTAIEEGATIIRVGTAIFGERIYPDSYYWNEKV